mmetsp:Transcript_1785/g.3115  ORF Transcript_1785/g.3115 Transcript_1785/m.3115 type:complete len:250 (-) Transcript_1785:591-1340(-)
MLRFSNILRVSTSAADTSAFLLSSSSSTPSATFPRPALRGSEDTPLVLATGIDDLSSSSAFVRAVISFLCRTVISSCLSASSLDSSCTCFSAFRSSSFKTALRESDASATARSPSSSFCIASLSPLSLSSSASPSSHFRLTRVSSMASSTFERADFVFSQRWVSFRSTASRSFDESASSLAVFFSAPPLSNTRRCRKGSCTPASCFAHPVLSSSSRGTALMLGSIREASTAMSLLSSVQSRLTHSKFVS